MLAADDDEVRRGGPVSGRKTGASCGCSIHEASTRGQRRRKARGSKGRRRATSRAVETAERQRRWRRSVQRGHESTCGVWRPDEQQGWRRPYQRASGRQARPWIGASAWGSLLTMMSHMSARPWESVIWVHTVLATRHLDRTASRSVLHA